MTSLATSAATNLLLTRPFFMSLTNLPRITSRGPLYRLLRPIGYCRFELNVWVWRSFFGLIRSLKTGLFLTFWKVTRRDSKRSGRLQKNTVLFKIVGKNSKNCLSLSNCVISNPLEQKKLDIACFKKVLKTIRFKDIFCFTEMDILKRFFR